MLKRMKSTLKWAREHWMVSSGAAAFLLIVVLLWCGSGPNQWDTLAFFGSVLGGLITWLGVHATIKHSADLVNLERKEKEIEEAAKKTRTLDDIASRLLYLQSTFSSNGFTIAIHREDENFLDWVKSTDKRHAVNDMRDLVNDSIGVDANSYKTLIRLEIFLNRIFHKDITAFSILNESVPLDEKIEEYLVRLKQLSDEIMEAHATIKNIRRHYLRILFPDDDPDTFFR